MTFAWDEAKAAANLRKHGVDFREAATVFGDALSTTFPDADHSVRDRRFITIGVSTVGRVLVVVHTEVATPSESSALGRRRCESVGSMKKCDEADVMRSEYNFAAMRGGVRGKHVRRVREQGSNVVLLDPDVAEAFPRRVGERGAQGRPQYNSRRQENRGTA